MYPMYQQQRIEAHSEATSAPQRPQSTQRRAPSATRGSSTRASIQRGFLSWVKLQSEQEKLRASASDMGAPSENLFLR